MSPHFAPGLPLTRLRRCALPPPSPGRTQQPAGARPARASEPGTRGGQACACGRAL